MIAQILVALQNYIGLDGFVRVHVDDIAALRAEVAKLHDAVWRSADAGRTTRNVALLTTTSCKRIDARLALIEPISQFDTEATA